MQYQGVVVNGVVVFGSGDRPPEAAAVQVTLIEPTPPTNDNDNVPGSTLFDRLRRFAGAIDDLPSDFALNHDHYIHGAVRK